jgi:hypothetical protein
MTIRTSGAQQYLLRMQMLPKAPDFFLFRRDFKMQFSFVGGSALVVQRFADMWCYEASSGQRFLSFEASPPFQFLSAFLGIVCQLMS